MQENYENEDSDLPSVSFKDRFQAAELLSTKLNRFRGKNALILGIPRGAIPMAQVLSDRLNGELDVILVHKIGAPENPELGIGSVSEFGTVHRSQAMNYFELPPGYIEKSARNEIARLRRRRKDYSPIRPPIDPQGRIVIIVDDGIATGSTMLAAIRAVRTQNAKTIVVASPVATPRMIELLKQEADEIVTLQTPEAFFSISQFYEEFPQVSDEEVFHILTEEG